MTELVPHTASKTVRKARRAPAEPRGERISPKLRQFIELLESGKGLTQKACAERVGLSENWVCKALRKPRIQAYVAQRRAANIAAGSLRASRRLVELLDGESEHVAAKVGLAMMETTGDIRPAVGPGVSVHISNNIAAGYVYDLRGPEEIAASVPHALPASLIDDRGAGHQAEIIEGSTRRAFDCKSEGRDE